jgi:glutamyl-tRNA(Gln) amidotransferase subunit E
VHQQLATAEKLFCRCPVGPYSSEWDAEIIRHMRPTLSELGAFDPTALMEFKTRKRIVYQITRDTTCTYEMDDAPPFRLNEEALDAALEVALLLKCNVVGEMHIARKQYLDGSIPTGFQRTALLGVDGEIPFRGRRVRIAQIGLEEDSARLVDDRGTCGRSGPTACPSRCSRWSPGRACGRRARRRRSASRSGDSIASRARVRTGLGTARQDVNVSIRGGTRTELKGVARIGEVPALVHVEAIRQRQLLLLRDEIRIRGVRLERWTASLGRPDGRLRPREPANLTSALAYGGRVTAVVLPGFAGLLAHPLQPGGIDFAGELADRVRVIACLDQLPNLLHSDDPEWGGLPGPDRIAVRKRAKLTDRDALVLVWGAAPDVRVAVEEIAFRAREAFLRGSRAESRQRAGRRGRSAFLRILPWC